MGKSYNKLLKDPRWQKKRLKVFERAGWACERCGDTKTELNVHHLFYDGRQPWEYPKSSLECLCKTCHNAEHDEGRSTHYGEPKPSVVGSIHIHKDGKHYGPYSLEQVRQFLKTGNFTENDLACHDGANWIKLSQVPGIFNAQILIHKNGKTYGPFSVEQIRGYVKEGNFSSEDHACHDGANWTKLSQVPGIIFH